MIKINDELRVEAGIEKIIIQEGYRNGIFTHGFFCLIERNGICVEDFGTTRRSALRYARKAWNKENNKKTQISHGYPRVRDCSG